MLALLFLGCLAAHSNALSPCGVKCAGSNSSYSLGYYWRDYFGTVPADAYPGGLDEEGDVTFIGQAYIKEYELLPGTIYRGCPKMLTSAYTFDLTPEKNIKILCSNVAYKLKWKPTKQGELHLLAGCHLVVAGSEYDLPIYIGRTNYKGQTIIGKAFPDDATNAGLWIPGTADRITEYEVLTYGC